jgi:hypothetical protein
MASTRTLNPAWVLLILAPAIGELLSSSCPPFEFFQPFTFVTLCVLYGGGAILVRELTLRWQRGWPTILVLGAAYGIVEEGLMVKSFFDPHWMDLGPLGSFGRWLGVNWVWSVGLMFYHAIVSIAVPILLVHLLFPRRRDTPWVGRRVLVLLGVLLAADVLLGFLAMTKYRPPWLPYLSTAAIVLALGWLSRRLPATFGTRWPAVRAVPAFPTLVLGFLATVSFFVVLWGLPKSGLHPLAVILLLVVVPVAAGYLALLLWRCTTWTERHQLALAAGVLGFFILLAPIREFAPNQPDNPRGMLAVGIAAVVFLVWLARRVRARAETAGERQMAA